MSRASEQCTSTTWLTFGDASSLWHATDRVFASALMMACGPILALRLAIGSVTIPRTLRNAWALAVTLGLACKALSGRASRTAQLDAYLLWHTLWHGLPVLSSVFLVAWAMDWEEERTLPQY